MWNLIASVPDHCLSFYFEDDHLSGKELFVRFTARAFRKLLSIYVFNYFLFSF